MIGYGGKCFYVDKVIGQPVFTSHGKAASR